MWKYLEQASFPLTEVEYQAHLDIASYVHAFVWWDGTGAKIH